MLSNPTKPAPAPLPTEGVPATLVRELRDATSATPFASCSGCTTPLRPRTPGEASSLAQTFANLATFQPRSTAFAQDASAVFSHFAIPLYAHAQMLPPRASGTLRALHQIEVSTVSSEWPLKGY
jgi:hypothetical protein